MFCLRKTLKAYMQKPMCPWEAPNSELLTVCRKYGPGLLCWGNIWTHRLANVGQLALSFQVHFPQHFYTHTVTPKDHQRSPNYKFQDRVKEPEFPILQSAMSQWKTLTLLILGMSLFCSLWGGEEGGMKTAIFEHIC